MATCLLGGVIAGALIPLFLQTIQSQLLNQPTLGDFTIFTGLCLIAAISSNAFIDTLTKRVIDELKGKVDVALETVKVADINASAAKANAKDANQASQTASKNAESDLSAAQANSEIMKPIAKSFADVPLQAPLTELRELSIANETVSQNQLPTLILKPALIFRSVEGVARESKQPESVVQDAFDQLEKQGEVKLIDKESKIYIIK